VEADAARFAERRRERKCHIRKENNGAQKWRENFLKNECLHTNKEIAHSKELIVPRM
jgi:hypothetical protein